MENNSRKQSWWAEIFRHFSKYHTRTSNHWVDVRIRHSKYHQKLAEVPKSKYKTMSGKLYIFLLYFYYRFSLFSKKNLHCVYTMQVDKEQCACNNDRFCWQLCLIIQSKKLFFTFNFSKFSFIIIDCQYLSTRVLWIHYRK